MREEREWRERGETGEDSGETKEGRRGEVRGNNIDSIHHSEDVDIHTVY